MAAFLQRELAAERSISCCVLKRALAFVFVIAVHMPSQSRAAMPDAIDGLGRRQNLQPSEIGRIFDIYCAPHPQDSE